MRAMPRTCPSIRVRRVAQDFLTVSLIGLYYTPVPYVARFSLIPYVTFGCLRRLLMDHAHRIGESSRRDFLKGACAAAGLAAVSPPLAEAADANPVELIVGGRPARGGGGGARRGGGPP